MGIVIPVVVGLVAYVLVVLVIAQLIHHRLTVRIERETRDLPHVERDVTRDPPPPMFPMF
jgi:hypothetical protein